MTHQVTLITELGPLRILGSNDAITAVLWPEQGGGMPKDASNSLLAQAATQLEEYLAGQRQHFTLPLAPKGTDFQQSVWALLRAIPYGVTRSYGDMAKELGKPDAARAVGSAIGKNPLSIIVPCHRVIGKSGKLTGFAGGLVRKEWLLARETNA